MTGRSDLRGRIRVSAKQSDQTNTIDPDLDPIAMHRSSLHDGQEEAPLGNCIGGRDSPALSKRYVACGVESGGTHGCPLLRCRVQNIPQLGAGRPDQIACSLRLGEDLDLSGNCRLIRQTLDRDDRQVTKRGVHIEFAAEHSPNRGEGCAQLLAPMCQDRFVDIDLQIGHGFILS